jgi:hypothetical protein
MTCHSIVPDVVSDRHVSQRRNLNGRDLEGERSIFRNNEMYDNTGDEVNKTQK